MPFPSLPGLLLSFLLGAVNPPVAGVTGRVVDEAGEPVIGAEVVLSVPDSKEDLRRSTFSGPQGRFKLPPIPSGWVLLTVTHPAYADLYIHDVEIPAGRVAVDLGSVTLAAGGVLEGKVTDARGTPIERAEVRIVAEIRTPGPDRRNLEINVKTGPDGIFLVKGLRRGERFEVMAKHPGYIPALLDEVLVPPEVPVRIKLKPLRRISGQVVDSQGDPIVEAVVTCKGRGSSYREAEHLGEVRDQTDAEGRFRLDRLPSGPVSVKASADGYLDSSADSLEIPEGRDLEDVEITLQQAHVLDVRVVDTGGEPVAGVTVTAKSDEEIAQRVERDTDSGGRCRLHVDPAKSYEVGTGLSVWALIACDKRASPSNRVHVPPRTGETQVELRLPAAAKSIEVSGRVLGEDGAGLPGIEVRISSDPDPLMKCNVTFTEADGSFLLHRTAGGTYTLDALKRGKTAAKMEIQLAADQPLRGLELRLGPEKGARLSGRILGVPPVDLRRTRILAQDSEGGYLSGTIGLQGTYQIDGLLLPGEWNLIAHAPHGHAFKTIGISPGQMEATLDLEVKEYLILSGRVLLDGEPLAGAAFEVLAEGGDDERYDVETAYDGTFRLTIDEPGPLTIKFSEDPADPGAGTVRTLYLAASQEIVIELSSKPD